MDTWMMVMAMAPAPGGEQQPSGTFFFGWIAIMIAIFYVMIIRPQRRRDKERQELLKNIKSGDRVLFSGGIVGIVTNAKEKTFTIKVGEKTKLEVLRGAVTQILDKESLPSDLDPELSSTK
ncbi:MAG TPA: preprotein translocase subunit YajC [Kiritimatiellia bacterium]|nr:preprotein translocase subunit YajC [Kiritimatiellia bacterium]HMO97665.1 preprotein translocase subunit YajC [Kiritimatiellia bacterium]HMP95526.1 preprotein translocase subunit YajC [Kiritimatiellia bacterium]